MLFNNDTSNCSTGARERNGTFKTSVASDSDSSALSVACRGCPDLSVVSGGSGSASDRVWMSSMPSIAKGTPLAKYNDILVIKYQLIEIIE